ncbi:Alpha/Beta hydrolase protein [Chytridium lagenaria]|nr:Alpha/Beta hydrolase protein [Chytridium lagenaria]
MTDEPPLDPTDPSYISVHTSFNSPTSRIFIHLPHLPRIAPAPPTPFFPSPPPPFPPKPTRRIAVAISGDPNGIPVVVHGGMNGSRFLAWLLHDLGVANGCKIIVPDRPGMGLSDPWDLTTFPTPSTYPLLTSSTPTPWRGGFLDWSHHLLHILDHLHLPKVALMGMSCGCIYSLAFAQQYPHRVLDHVPIQLFACWVPPSLSECGWVVKSSMVVPTVAVVTTLTSVQRLVLDPGYAGVVNGFSKAAKVRAYRSWNFGWLFALFLCFLYIYSLF